MKMYCFTVKVDGRVCEYCCEADRLDQAIQNLEDFANISCRCYRRPLHVCSVYETYRTFNGVKVSPRRYGLRRKLPPILKAVHSSEFYLDKVESLVLADFIEYSRSWNGF